jgi:hypothetical protein
MQKTQIFEENLRIGFEWQTLENQQVIANIIKSEIQQQSQTDKEEEIEMAKIIKKEIEINREVTMKENGETKAILVIEREEEDRRYKDLHEGLEAILRNSNWANPQLKDTQESNRFHLQMNSEV